MFPSSFDGLISLVDILRSKEGCPWDREQTAQSMKRYFLDECYELIDAIDDNDPEKLAEEIGDVLFNVAFQMHMANQTGLFPVNHSFSVVLEKFVRRHPHVFSDKEISDSKQAWTSWDAIKRSEQSNRDDSILDTVARSSPALSQAQLLQERSSRLGFDWENVEGVLSKIVEEVEELHLAETKDQREAELGDLIFSLVNFSRWLGSDAETALRASNNRFRARFRHMETMCRSRGVLLESLTLEEKEALWEEAKEALR